ncbi:NAF domain [Dillenia turbinata]|uniref:non-specific serine/threonine protein kinase n=1 Tax=Dillenia turbinata TaxID=194707 RepID=A0AAN8VIE9_9MAGN
MLMTAPLVPPFKSGTGQEDTECRLWPGNLCQGLLCSKYQNWPAIKVIDKEKVLKVGLAEQIKQEISVIGLVKHPNIVQRYEVMATKMKIYFVLEYAKGGELFNKVAKGRLREEVALKYFQQLTSAVDFCRSWGVYQRDLKPENILLDENKKLKHQDGLLHTTCGTPAYVAPEVINRRGYNGAKADIYSCGGNMHVLLAAYLPFHDSNLMEMYRKIGKAEFKCPNWFSAEVHNLLSEKTVTKRKDFPPLDAEATSGRDGRSGTSAETKQEPAQPATLNAFDIISLSSGFDLSGVFDEDFRKKEARFTPRKPASVIISKLEDLA